MPFPNPNVTPQSFTWRDAKGHTTVTRFFINYDAGTIDDAFNLAQAIRDALKGLTNAALQSASGVLGETGSVQYGGTGVFQSVQQKARMTWQDDEGKLHRYEVPAPKVAIFLADAVTVNPTNALVLAYIASFTTVAAFVSGKDGIEVAQFVGGEFAARPRPRRVGILTLTPALTPEEPE